MHVVESWMYRLGQHNSLHADLWRRRTTMLWHLSKVSGTKTPTWCSRWLKTVKYLFRELHKFTRRGLRTSRVQTIGPLCKHTMQYRNAAIIRGSTTTATNHDDQLGEIYPTMLNELNCTFDVSFSRFQCCGRHCHCIGPIIIYLCSEFGLQCTWQHIDNTALGCEINCYIQCKLYSKLDFYPNRTWRQGHIFCKYKQYRPIWKPG